MLYRHLQHHNNTIIKTQWQRQTQEDFFIKIFTSHFIARVRKGVTQGLRVRGSWRPNRNFNILTSSLMAVNVVSFSFFWCSTGGTEAHSARWWLPLLHLISNFSGPQTPSGFPRAPSARCGFPYHISSFSDWNSNSTATAPSAGCGFPYHISSVSNSTGTPTDLTSVLTELYNSSTPTWSPTRSLKSHV